MTGNGGLPSDDAFEQYRTLVESMPKGIAGSVEMLLRQMDDTSASALRLSAIPHHLDDDILQVLLPDLSEETSGALYDELANLSFMNQTSGVMLMHDEVRRYLFQQWLIPENQPRFREVSARLAGYFRNREGALSNEEEIGAQVQNIFHQIGADPDKGFPQFEYLCRRERYRFRLHACETVIKLVHEYDEILKPEHAAWLSYHEAKLLLDLRRHREAETLLRHLLADERLSPELGVRCIFRLGRIHQARREWDDAIETFRKGLRYIEQHPETADQEVKMLQGLSTALQHTGDSKQAGDLLATSIMLAEEQGDRSALAFSYNSLGNLHRRLGQTTRAVEAFEQSLTYLNRNDEQFRPAQVYNNLGLTYGDRSEWDNARNWLEKSLEIARQAGDTNGQAIALSNLGRVYLNLSERQLAVETADKAVEMFLKIHNWYGAAATCVGIARYYRRAGRIPEARGYFTRASELFNRAQAFERVAEVENEIERLGQRKKLPWYAIAAIVLFALFILLILVALLFA